MTTLSDVDAITFDCYGTLIDWETGILETLKPLFIRYGLESRWRPRVVLEKYAEYESAEQIKDYTSYRHVLGRVMDHFFDSDDIVLSAEDRDALAESIAGWKPFPDSVESLRALAAVKPLGVLSNIDNDLLTASLDQLGVSFQWVITAEQVQAYKPSPAHFAEFLRQSGLDPSRVLHVAQSMYHDINPAQELGFQTVWINRREGKDGGGATPASQGEPGQVFPSLAAFVASLSL
ncbi:MAG TPA: haloacid dehalogenase type II [Kiritimatiellia bacterium]|nr:haloacid dehalogenase type II [Kiritimatiellia bacterium]